MGANFLGGEMLGVIYMEKLSLSFLFSVLDLGAL